MDRRLREAAREKGKTLVLLEVHSSKERNNPRRKLLDRGSILGALTKNIGEAMSLMFASRSGMSHWTSTKKSAMQKATVVQLSVIMAALMGDGD